MNGKTVNVRLAKSEGLRMAARWLRKVRPDEKTMSYGECQAVIAALQMASKEIIKQAERVEGEKKW